MKFHLSNALFAVLPLTVYGSSHLKSTAVAVELGNQPRALVALYTYPTPGNEPPANAFPLPACHGDCDNDDQCQPDLICFQRSPTDPFPPGCSGAPVGGNDYCVIKAVAPATFNAAMPACTFVKNLNPTPSETKLGSIVCRSYPYGASGFNIRTAIYDSACDNPATPTGVSVRGGAFPQSLVTGSTSQYMREYVYNVDIYDTAVPQGDLEICLLMEVYDTAGDVYDWIGQKITLALSVDGDFTTDSLSTALYDGTTNPLQNTGSLAFKVSILRCDANGGEITGGGAPLNVGDNFFLCVRGSESQVVVNTIQGLAATKDSENIALIADKVSNANTFVFGEGQNQVVIATRLPSPFFLSAGSVTFEGSANIVVNGRRRLSRSMQALEAEESADFSMDIGVTGMDDASSASAIRATAAMLFAAVFAALIV